LANIKTTQKITVSNTKSWPFAPLVFRPPCCIANASLLCFCPLKCCLTRFFFVAIGFWHALHISSFSSFSCNKCIPCNVIALFASSRTKGGGAPKRLSLFVFSPSSTSSSTSSSLSSMLLYERQYFYFHTKTKQTFGSVHALQSF